MGNITQDLELKQVNDKQVIIFSIAVNRKKEGTDFISIVAWNTTATFISKYFSKGQKIAIVGRLQTRDYEDTQGKKHYVTEVVAEEAYFTGKKEEKGDAYEPEGISDLSDLPF